MPLAPAAEIAEMLVEPILGDLDFTGGDGVLAFVNGMGGTPLLELYLMYHEVDRAPGEGRDHRGPLAGRQLHHQPRHGRLLGHPAQASTTSCSGCGTRPVKHARRCGGACDLMTEDVTT